MSKFQKFVFVFALVVFVVMAVGCNGPDVDRAVVNGLKQVAEEGSNAFSHGMDCVENGQGLLVCAGTYEK